MPIHKAQSLALISVGVVILWVGWGNVLDLSATAGELCYRPNASLHLDSFFQLVYRDTDCGAQVYDYALPVFLLLSVVGNGAIMVGLYHFKQSNKQAD